MRIQYVSKYLALAEKGLIQKTECPLDQGLLSCNIDMDDNIIIYCLSCKYKKIVGINFYNDIVKKVDEVENAKN